MCVLGGVDVKDAVWRSLKHCMVNSVAKKINWRGVNGKLAFQKLHLKGIITETVRNNPLSSKATNQEVEMFIKRWLHLASDRDGGRREREVRKQRELAAEASEGRHQNQE